MFVFPSGILMANGVEVATLGETVIQISSDTHKTFGQFYYSLLLGPRRMTMTTTATVDRSKCERLLAKTSSGIALSALLKATDPTTGKDFTMLVYNLVVDDSQQVTPDGSPTIFYCRTNSEEQVCQLNFGEE